MDKLVKQLFLYDLSDTALGRFVALDKDNDCCVSAIGNLLEWGRDWGINGNLWHYCVAYAIAMNENAFSLSCERRPLQENSSITKIALKDMATIKAIFDYDLSSLAQVDRDTFDLISDFRPFCDNPYRKNCLSALTYLVEKLEKASDNTEFLRATADYYQNYGVGEWGLHSFFRIDDNKGILPIDNSDRRQLSDLIGYELQKKQVVDNTLAFLQNRPANNVLLYGDGGTGKSSTIKAIVNEFGKDGLKIIEVYKHQFKSISNVISEVKDRNYKFVIYLDDLSFEEFEIEYKYFKAIIEGGLETKPDNVIIYATSNRRHLIKETWSDKDDMKMEGEVRRSDTLQEKLSLVSRFGLSIFYGSPNMQEFLEIVKALAKKQGVNIDEQTLEQKARQWEIRGGGKSGRSAQQFINSLL
ncbi:MAG: ATP-binding protein [Christensenellales bacterium]